MMALALAALGGAAFASVVALLLRRRTPLDEAPSYRGTVKLVDPSVVKVSAAAGLAVLTFLSSALWETTQAQQRLYERVDAITASNGHLAEQLDRATAGQQRLEVALAQLTERVEGLTYAMRQKGGTP